MIAQADQINARRGRADIVVEGEVQQRSVEQEPPAKV
jgi:hypothetical protein